MRLNHAATNALMARLESQKAICDASERDINKKFKQRTELEKQLRPEWEHTRKKSRMDDTLHEDADHKPCPYLLGTKPSTPLHKELRVFLEEERKASEDRKTEEIEEELKKSAKSLFMKDPDEHNKSIVALENYEIPIEHKLQALDIGDGKKEEIQFPSIRVQVIEEDEDEESRKQRGKGNVERWLQMLLENSQDELEPENSNGHEKSMTDDIITKLNQKFPQEAKSSKHPGFDQGKKIEEIVEIEANKTETRTVKKAVKI